MSRLRAAFDENLTHRKQQIPVLFWFNALLIASNGTDSRVGSLTADWERFFEWQPRIQGDHAVGFHESHDGTMRVNRAFSSCTVDMPPRSPYLPSMHWVAQSAKDTASETLEKRLWYDDHSTGSRHGRFNSVFASLPFNVNAVNKERLKASVGLGRRFPFGLPRTDNAIYTWIQLFHSALKTPSTRSGQGGRDGFVMANSACDARTSEQETRHQLIESRALDVMVAVGPNMFCTIVSYTSTSPLTFTAFAENSRMRSRLNLSSTL